MQRAEFTFFHPLRVRYVEVDAQAVVYNSHYVTYYDIAITEFLRASPFDYSLGAVAATGKDFHTVKVTVDYQTPAFYDDELEVGVRAGRIGRSSITWVLAVFRHGEDESLSTGEVIWVYTDMAAHKSTPLPEGFAAAVQAIGA